LESALYVIEGILKTPQGWLYTGSGQGVGLLPNSQLARVHRIHETDQGVTCLCKRGLEVFLTHLDAPRSKRDNVCPKPLSWRDPAHGYGGRRVAHARNLNLLTDLDGISMGSAG
jgi:hypothetical protein